MKQLDIGIVGGSIAGCSAAVLLARAGHRVRVVERSRGGLVGRGGGIGTPLPVLESLIAADLLDPGFPHLVSTSMPFIVRTEEEPERGHVPWEMPLSIAVFHWSALWNELRRRVPDESYRGGCGVRGATTLDDGVRLELDDGTSQVVDLAIFADGYRSLGRALLFPDAPLDYRGYMLWRGLLPEARMHDPGVLGSTMPRLSYRDGRGNMVAYLVPDENGSTEPGQRLVNWAAYIPLPADELDAFMVDRSGTRRTGTIPPGEMRPEREAALKESMAAALPEDYAAIVTDTTQTYVQLIYTSRVPSYGRDRMCLVGDAGSVAQPFTGSGVFKGQANTAGLIRAMEEHADLDDALSAWSEEQVASADRLLALGEQMERAFIWNGLDLAHADAEDTERWWRGAVTFPEGFTYEDESAD